MSDWVKEAADRLRDKQNRAGTLANVVNITNYLIALRIQLGRDIDAINVQFAPLVPKLTEEPIQLHDRENGFKIEKILFPAVIIEAANGGDRLSVKTRTIRNHGAKPVDKLETYKVLTEDDRVVLHLNGEDFIAPRLASKRILQPIVDSLDN